MFMGQYFYSSKGLTISNNSVVNQNCVLDTRGGIYIGSNVSVSAEVCILTADHDPSAPTFSGRIAPVRIHDFAFIGTRAIILPGVTIGHGAVVAAGSVVSRDVPELSVVAGVPAKVIKHRNPKLDYKVDYKRRFW